MNFKQYQHDMNKLSAHVVKATVKDLFQKIKQDFLKYGELVPGVVPLILSEETQSVIGVGRNLLHLADEFGIDYATGNGRYEVLERLGAQLGHQRVKVVGVIMATEVWYTDHASLDEFTVRPSQNPARKEAVMVVGSPVGGDPLVKMAEIVRQGDTVDLLPAKKGEQMVESNLLHAFWASYLISYVEGGDMPT